MAPIRDGRDASPRRPSREVGGLGDPALPNIVSASFHGIRSPEPWLANVRPLREVVLLTGVKRGSPELLPVLPAATLHGARLLEEIGLQFDIATAEEDWPEAALVIWPAGVPLDSRRQAALDQHVASGGSLLILGREDPSASSRKGPDAAGHVARASSSFLRALPVLELPVKQVTLEPSGESVPFNQQDGVCSFVVPSMRVWQMLALHA